VPGDHPRLAAVHGRHGEPDRAGQGRLAHQRHLGVEHNARSAADHGGRRGVAADAPLDPQRPIAERPDLLGEHERAGGAHPPAALGAPGHQAAGPGGQRGSGLVGGADLGREAPLPAPGAKQPGLGHHHGVHRGGQVVGPEGAAGVDPHAEGGIGAPGDLRQGVAGAAGVRPEVEHAEPPGPGCAYDDPGLRLPERRLHPDEIHVARQRSTDMHAASPYQSAVVAR
jgi:hypothetical protein